MEGFAEAATVRRGTKSRSSATRTILYIQAQSMAARIQLEGVVLLTGYQYRFVFAPLSQSVPWERHSLFSLDPSFDRIGAADVEHRVCFGDGCLDAISLSKVGHTLA